MDPCEYFEQRNTRYLAARGAAGPATLRDDFRWGLVYDDDDRFIVTYFGRPIVNGTTLAIVSGPSLAHALDSLHQRVTNGWHFEGHRDEAAV